MDVKLLAVMLLLTKNRSCDVVVDSDRMSEETVRRYFHYCLQGLRETFGPIYHISRHMPNELSELKCSHLDAGFLRCIGVVDCCHLTWKICLIIYEVPYNSRRNSK